MENTKDEFAKEKGFNNWEDLIYMTIIEQSPELACDSIIEYENELIIKIYKNEK